MSKNSKKIKEFLPPLSYLPRTTVELRGRILNGKKIYHLCLNVINYVLHFHCLRD